MTENKTTRSERLLNKVYDHLDAIDVSKLSMSEIKDFLEVVQKGQFLESYGQMSGFGGLGYCAVPSLWESKWHRTTETATGDGSTDSDK